MSKKKDRAFFVCPRWHEVAAPHAAGSVPPGRAAPGASKIIAAIRSGQPVARSTLRKALQDARQSSGVMFDIDDYMVDRRTTQSD